MIATSRILNRAILMVVGVVVLACGLAAIGLVTLPEFRRSWASVAAPFHNWLSDQASATPLGDTRHSSLWIAVAAVCVLVMALGLWFVLSRGRGRTSTALLRPSGDAAGGVGAGGTDAAGTIAVDAAVVEQAITATLAERHELLAVHVNAYRVRRQRALKVSVITRRGADPTRVATYVEEAVRGWDTVLGAELPVLIEIGADIRSRIRSTARVAE